MDTREKIVPLENAVERTATGKWIAVLACLDPLTAAAAAYLTGIAEDNPGCLLCVIVLESETALLPAAARMALAAALRSVNLVTSATGEIAYAAFSTGSPGLTFIDLTEPGIRSTQDFVDLVIAKQRIVTA